MNHALALIAFILPLFAFTQGELEDGFYIPVDASSCGNQSMEFANERFCLPYRPLFNLDVVASVSNLSRAENGKSFELTFKPEDAQKLRKAIKQFNGLKMVIVLNHELVGLIQFEQLSNYNKLYFHSTRMQGKIEDIHAYLRKALNVVDGKREGQ